MPILSRVELHSSGVLLRDVNSISPADLMLWQDVQSDALCVVVVGHTCPRAETCSGKVTAPAFCNFAMHREDLPPGSDWQTIVSGPAKAVQHAFSEVGISKAITSPWGRTYQAAGKPSVPHLCDTFMFRAKVSKTDIAPLLQKSGFNHVPREALIIIVQFICRRVADIYFGSRPNDPSRYDEAVEMWIEDCAARNVLVRSHRVMIRSIQIRIKIVSVSAVCRMASLAKHWCEAVDSTFHGEYFLLFKEVEPSTWEYIKARWVTDCLLYVTAESKYLDLLLLTKRRS